MQKKRKFSILVSTMENQPSTQPPAENTTTYIIGALVVVAAIIAAVMFWPKPKPVPAPTASQPEVTPAEPTTITKFACERQWFNPKLGYQQYYLSSEGVDVVAPASAECTITVLQGDKTLKTEKLPATMIPAPERNGTLIRCTTKALDLPKGTPLTMRSSITNDLGVTASCSAGSITLP